MSELARLYKTSVLNLFQVGDYAILIQSGMKPMKAIMMQLVTAVGALTGILSSKLTLIYIFLRQVKFTLKAFVLISNVYLLGVR